MNRFYKIVLCSLFFQSLAFSKTVCTMTFNSSDEKRVFQKELSPLGHQIVELVPDNKDPMWLQKSCEELTLKNQQCDSLLISGHFGGIFFGEQKSTTLLLSEMMAAKNQGLCPAVFEKPKSVFLMGCNTLSGKTPDKRSVIDYLHVLVGDGFPLDLAENVAAARYLSFGQSMSDQMISIFSSANFIAGFESTGPLGAAAAPLLTKAFAQTPLALKKSDFISKVALKAAFANTNLRIAEPAQLNASQALLHDAVSSDLNVATNAWQKLLIPQNIVSYFDFIIENQSNTVLKSTLQYSIVFKKNIVQALNLIYNKSAGLAAIQRKINSFFFINQLIDEKLYLKRQSEIINQILKPPLDYVSADQVCQAFESEKNKDLIHNISSDAILTISKSRFSDFIFGCASVINNKIESQTKSYQCLKNQTTYDWACLTENESTLDISSCKLAHTRNTDPENSDDMLWFCYSKMLDYKRLDQSLCLQLTHSFSLLGNRIKMNWNCQNRL